MPFGNLRSVDVGEVDMLYIDLENWRPGVNENRDRAYKSKEAGYTRPLYNRDGEDVVSGLLHVVSELAPVNVENILHGNITIIVDGRAAEDSGLDMSPLGGDISLLFNAFEMQGLIMT